MRRGALVDFNAQFDGRSLTTFEKGGRYLVDTGNVNVMQISHYNVKEKEFFLQRQPRVVGGLMGKTCSSVVKERPLAPENYV